MAENKQADNDELDYNPELDSTVKRLSGKHVHIITIKDINQLRINRDIKRKELTTDAAFDAALYAEPPEEGGGGMGI